MDVQIFTWKRVLRVPGDEYVRFLAATACSIKSKCKEPINKGPSREENNRKFKTNDFYWDESTKSREMSLSTTKTLHIIWFLE